MTDEERIERNIARELEKEAVIRTDDGYIVFLRPLTTTTAACSRVTVATGEVTMGYMDMGLPVIKLLSGCSIKHPEDGEPWDQEIGERFALQRAIAPLPRHMREKFWLAFAERWPESPVAQKRRWKFALDIPVLLPREVMDQWRRESVARLTAAVKPLDREYVGASAPSEGR